MVAILVCNEKALVISRNYQQCSYIPRVLINYDIFCPYHQSAMLIDGHVQNDMLS
jgi:hypothetical protein